MEGDSLRSQIPPDAVWLTSAELDRRLFNQANHGPAAAATASLGALPKYISTGTSTNHPESGHYPIGTSTRVEKDSSPKLRRLLRMTCYIL